LAEEIAHLTTKTVANATKTKAREQKERYNKSFQYILFIHLYKMDTKNFGGRENGMFLYTELHV
jgi:hypothetical protein